MSFKILILYILTVLVSASCGVKGPPRPPTGSTIPSLESEYAKKLNTSENIKEDKSEAEESQ